MHNCLKIDMNQKEMSWLEKRQVTSIKFQKLQLNSGMQYNKLIEKSFSLIKYQREEVFNDKIDVQSMPIPQKQKNIYIQLLGIKGKKLFKLEQWNFICELQMFKSSYGQQDDPQLDSINMPKKSFLATLEESLQKLCPKLLFKTLEPEKLKLRIKMKEEDLEPFGCENSYLKEIDQYQTEAYSCKLTFKYNYEECAQTKVMSSEQQFELLIDESYENAKIEKIKEQRKFSEDILSLSKLQTKNSEKNEQMIMMKKKIKENVIKVREMLTNTNFNLFPGKTLQQFKTSH